uniref:DNA-directed RNA polymerase n=1 Tax=Plukenetia volubilis TaxID=316893 RepID=A0A291LRA6_9ROSI|nr:RNA polymerase beta [Plukenetia volubilis]
MNQNFSSMIDRYKHQQLRIGLVSPQQISAWANKILPNGEIVGEVTKPYTFHYKTNKPEKDGLFCERIFGPIKSGICACGNYRVIRNEKEKPKFCEQCGVEFVDSRVRRYQMGYIKLACPVTHVWYLKRLPSYIANLLDKPLKELEGLVYCDVCFDRNYDYDFTVLECKTVIPFIFGCPGSDMSRERSNMKLRIMGVFNTPKSKRNWSMVDAVTKKSEFLVVPRENRLYFYSKNRKKLCLYSSNQICHGYRSLYIAYRLSSHRGITEFETSEIESKETSTNKSLMNSKVLGISHSKGSRLLKNFISVVIVKIDSVVIIESRIQKLSKKKNGRMNWSELAWGSLFIGNLSKESFFFGFLSILQFESGNPFLSIWYNYLSRMRGNFHVRFGRGEILWYRILSQFFFCWAHSQKTYFFTITRFIRIRNPILEIQYSTFFYCPRLRYISKSRNFYRSWCYPKTISRSRFANYYRLFSGRMERIRGKRAYREWVGRSKSWKKKGFFGWTRGISWAFYSNKYRTRMDGFMSITSSSPRVEADHSDRWGWTNEFRYWWALSESYLSEQYSYCSINNKSIYTRGISNVSGKIGTRSCGYTSCWWNPRTTNERRSWSGLQVVFGCNCRQRREISCDYAWKTGCLFRAFRHCRRPLTFITPMWIASRNSNRTFPDICNSWSNSTTSCFEHRSCWESNSGKRANCMGNTSGSYAGASGITEWSANFASIRHTGIPTHFSGRPCYLFTSISLSGIQCRLCWGSNGCSCTFIVGGSSGSSFTYVFSYESLISSYWRSHFRTNSRYAYWALCINKRESSRYLCKQVWSMSSQKFSKWENWQWWRSIYERILFFWFLWCNWCLSAEKNQFRWFFVAPVATRSTRYCFKRSSRRSSLCIFGYLSCDLCTLTNSKKYKKRNSLYIHSNYCWSYLSLSRNRRSYTRVLPSRLQWYRIIGI